MIAGVVNIHREAVIHLTVRGSQGEEREFEAIVDTGFNGWLSLPSTLISLLGLPFRRRGRAILADGRESVFDIHEAVVIWDGEARRIVVDNANTDPLVGMGLLYGYELTIQATNGGRVLIKKLPS